MAHNVLDDHHRVIDHETDADRQRHKREVVEAVTELIERCEGADER